MDPTGTGSPATADDVWVVLPTYNERENLELVVTAILQAYGSATVLVVDDASPDGTGEIADALAAADTRVRVLHRPGKQGLGRAYLDGFADALSNGASIVVQMDADFSHDPQTLPALVAPISDGTADLVIGSRYTEGGSVEDWGLMRRIISRSGSIFARNVLRVTPHDVTGGFKAWRASALRAISFAGVRAGGYVFQIEMTYRATQAGARVREIPITFRDRQAGASKMSRRIIVEAFVVVVQLRLDERRGRPTPQVEPGGQGASD